MKQIELGWRMIIIRNFKFERQEVEWIFLAEHGDSWVAFVNTVMNICLHKM